MEKMATSQLFKMAASKSKRASNETLVKVKDVKIHTKDRADNTYEQ